MHCLITRMHTLLQHKQALRVSRSEYNTTASMLTSCTSRSTSLETKLAESTSYASSLERAVLSSGRMQVKTWKDLEQVTTA
jgi:hypothetical protein